MKVLLIRNHSGFESSILQLELADDVGMPLVLAAERVCDDADAAHDLVGVTSLA